MVETVECHWPLKARMCGSLAETLRLPPGRRPSAILPLYGTMKEAVAHLKELASRFPEVLLTLGWDIAYDREIIKYAKRGWSVDSAGERIITRFGAEVRDWCERDVTGYLSLLHGLHEPRVVFAEEDADVWRHASRTYRNNGMRLYARMTGSEIPHFVDGVVVPAKEKALVEMLRLDARLSTTLR